jgi:manganese efflux pump family protein
MSLLRLLVFILPLGLDTLGVSISLGIKSHRPGSMEKIGLFTPWLSSALLFSLAETLMPLVGLAIGFIASLVVSSIMHFVGPLLLIGVGIWELLEEGSEYISKRKPREVKPILSTASNERFEWSRQLLLALSISLDELAIGFSLGSLTTDSASGKIGVSEASLHLFPIALCLLIGLQAFFMTLIGLVLGRTLSTRLKVLKEWSEILSALLLIGLGIWLLVT